MSSVHHDPTAALQSSLYHTMLDHPHAILVIVGTETPETRSYFQSLLTPHSSGSSRQAEERAETIWTKLPKVVYVDPSQALESLYAFKKNPTSLHATGNYQHGKLSSHISDFDSAVSENLTEAKRTLGKDASARGFTAVALFHRSLNLARRSPDASSHEVGDLTRGIGELLGGIEKAKVCLHSGVLGVGWRPREGDWDGRS